ncbi:MAG TPA: hypothetical protein VNW51_00205, partial [Mucilaginibacter sp.]|nr:hypothetical protein [Mucilaginibacter sp.]
MRFYQKATACLWVLFVLFSPQTKAQNVDWPIYGGSKKSIRYSALKQINAANVKQLQVAWTYHTGDADLKGSSQMQCNPIIVDGILYGTTPHLSLIALDAATGEKKWLFNAEEHLPKKTNLGVNNNRGVTYWQSGNDKRILYCAGSNLYEVNAMTGELIGS